MGSLDVPFDVIMGKRFTLTASHRIAMQDGPRLIAHHIFNTTFTGTPLPARDEKNTEAATCPSTFPVIGMYLDGAKQKINLMEVVLGSFSSQSSTFQKPQ